MYRNILVSIDLVHGNADLEALNTAIEYARAFGATLNLINVVPDYGLSLVGSFFPPDYEKHTLEAANKALHEYAERHVPAEIKRRHIVGHGSIYHEILRYADEVEADLIVISAHRPTAKDYLIGPNAARVVRHAQVAVLVVRTPEPA
jgi:nucleotide-binding universal stress UspA family protein